jgi:hypothetical protein
MKPVNTDAMSSIDVLNIGFAMNIGLNVQKKYIESVTTFCVH